MVAAAEAIVKTSSFEVPPPAGFVTVTTAVPALAISAAVMSAVTVVESTKTVVLGAPAQLTTAPETNETPVQVKTNAGPPSSTLDGARLVRERGAGPPEVIVNVRESELTLSGFTTVTRTLPCVTMSAAVICATSWVGLTNVVERADPPHRTTAPDWKLLPEHVSWKAGPPAAAVEGEMPDRIGPTVESAVPTSVAR